MPEGDTIFKLAAYLDPRLRGRRLVDGRAGTPPVDLAERRVESVEALGKHLLIRFDDGRVLRSHLGMWGSWHWYPRGAPWRKPARQAGIVLDTGDRVFVCFNPQEVEMLNPGGVRRRVLAARTGPDLLAPELTLGTLVPRARELIAGDAIIADVLLDQRVACGIGNVYKAEVLFLERTAPETRLAALSDDELEALYGRARNLLQRNTGSGARVTRPGGRLWVYGRRGRPCFRCGEAIRCARLGQRFRSTYWCPACQPARASHRRV